MKKFTIPLIVLASLILFIGANKDRFVKMKVLTQVLRLVMDNYVEDVDIDDILDTSKMKEFSHNKGKIGTKYEILEEGKGNKEYSCNSCGALGKWVRIKAGWRLMNKMGQIHECGKRKGKGRKYAK